MELFIGAPDGSGYFNFEMNCIGTLLAASRKSRDENVVHFAPEQLRRIIRHTTLPRKTFAERTGICEWEAAVGIPFDLLGCADTPARLRTNLYKCADGARRPHFVSWNPVTTPEPDFHRPEFFGEFILG